MGNENSNSNIRYKSKNRAQSIVVENLDNFPYPPLPPKENVLAELYDILSQLNLEPEKEKLILNQPTEIQWKVICRHKQVLEDNIESINKAARSPVQIFIDKILENPSITNLEELRIWLEEKANDDDLSSFMAFDGLKILLQILENAEMSSKKTKKYHRQIVVLKILENLVNNNNQVIEKILALDNGLTSIIINFNKDSPELCNSVFEILNSICWSSNADGHTPIINAFNYLKTVRKYRYPFQPLIELLQEEKNIVLIENAVAFINTIIESALDEEERRNIRFQFYSCNLKQIYDKIREKIFTEQYNIEDCLFEKIEENPCFDHEIFCRISKLGKTVYIERDQEEFEKHILQIINQIEVFEKTSEESLTSSISNFDEQGLSSSRRTTKEKIDYTNINSVFEKLKNDSMTNNTFSFLLEILNYMILIPRNKAGQMIWEKMAFFFAEATQLEEKDFNSKLQELQNLVKKTRDIEDLEVNNINLQQILQAREEEIDKLISEKNKCKLDLSKFQKEAEEIIKKYQEIEVKLEGSLTDKDKLLSEKNEEINKLKQILQDQNSKDSFIKYESQISELIKQISTKDMEIRNLEIQKKKSEDQKIVTLPPPPPPNILGVQILPPPPPPNILGVQILPPPPPPNILGVKILPPPPPPNILGVQIPPPPINLFSSSNNISSPPVLSNLLGQSVFSPPPLSNLLGPPPLLSLLGQSGPPSLTSLLNQPGPPGPPLLLGIGGGGPPPIGNLLMGKGGPPPIGNLFPLNQAIKKMKEKKKPRIPLKGLMWTLIPPANIKETIWEDIDDEKIDLDIDFLEKEFASKKPAIIDSQKKESQINKIVKVSILPPEKNKNMEIVLGKLKFSNSIIKDALNNMDETILTINNIESLLNIIPTEEEVRAVEAFEGDSDLLGNPEKFTLEINQVSGYKERLLGMKFVKNYEDSVLELTSKLEKINKILENIPKDKKFKQLVEEILAIGNYLNGTGNRGGAYGFHLDTLEKLNDLKMLNCPKKNLLMYIVQKYEKKNNASVIEHDEDLSDYELAAKTPISQLQSDLGEIKRGSKIINNAIAKSEESDEFGKVEEYFTGPSEKLNGILEKLEKNLKICEENFLKCSKFLCENPKDTPSDKLIEKIYKFWNSCKIAKKILLKEQEQIKKEEDKIKKETDRKKSKTEQTLMTGINSLKMGTPEEIVESLKNRRQTKRIFSEFVTKDNEKTDTNKKNMIQEMKGKAINSSKNEISEPNSPRIKVSTPCIEEKSNIIEEKHKNFEEKSKFYVGIPKITEENLKAMESKLIILSEKTKTPTEKPKNIPEEPKSSSEKKSPQYKKANVIKTKELKESGSLSKIEVKIGNMEENKKIAPIVGSRGSVQRITPCIIEKKPTVSIDYLSVLKKNKPENNEIKSSQTESVSYLANILTDGAIKKKSILSSAPLNISPLKDQKK